MSDWLIAALGTVWVTLGLFDFKLLEGLYVVYGSGSGSVFLS